MRRVYFHLYVAALVLVLGSTGANAQQQWANTPVTTVAQPGVQYVNLGGQHDSTSVACTATLNPPTYKFCADGKGISLDQFANETDVTDRFTAISAQMSALQSGLNGAVAAQNRSFGKAFDLIAADAALKDAVPNAGDRFALRINAGGFNGHLAGGVSGSVNVSDQVRFSMNYAHGNSEQIFSGGLNFSFH